MRVLHAPVNVGNQPWVLSRYERTLGIRSDLAVNYNTWLGYQSDYCLSGYADKSLSSVARRLRFGLLAPVRYDVLHFYFGRSLLCWDDYGPPNRFWFLDLKLAKRLGRKVFMTLQGCDVRLSDESASNNRFTPCSEGHCPAAPTCRTLLDERRRALIREILPQADRVFVLNPELARFVPGATFVPYASVDVAALRPVYPQPSGSMRIVHAPSDPHIKGTRYITEAITQLSRRFPIEFIEVRDMPHTEAMKIYQSADLIIDQVLAGWYGGLAVEAMAMGKPVACYMREEDFHFLPAAMRTELPLLRIAPDTLLADLERIFHQRASWPEWGQRARAYVLRWHHPAAIAQAMVNAYQQRGSPFNLAPAPI